MPQFNIISGGQLRATPAFAFIAEAWYAMVKAEQTPENVALPTFNPQAEVLYATGAGPDDIVGVVVFSRVSGNVTVELLYVEPSARRQGCARMLLTELRARQPAGARIAVPIEGDNPGCEDLLSSMGGHCMRVVFEVVA